MIVGYNVSNLGAEQAYNYFNQQADNEAGMYQAQDIATFGDSYHNRMADRNAQKASEAFNAWQAQLQRDYEERMDNSKFQRAAKDLASIGFSPLALLSNSPGSAPSGVAASYSTGAKTRQKSKSAASDLAALAIRVLGLILLKG